MRSCVPLITLLAAQRVSAQQATVLHGRVIDSAGVAVAANVTIRSAASGTGAIATATAGADGSFAVSLPTLPARVMIEVALKDSVVARVDADSLAVRGSAEKPLVIHVRAPHPLAAVHVRARYQKRASIYAFMNAEPSSRTESAGVGTEWLDPLAYGDAGVLLRSDPDLMVGADGSASLLGAPGTSNQVELGGVRVPAALVSGAIGGSITPSQWDVTNGGAAGATINLMMRPAPSRYYQSAVTLRSGVGGVPSWIGSRGQPNGLDIPAQISASSDGPIGRFGYVLNAFLSSDISGLPRWDRTLGAQQRGVLDSLTAVLDAPTVRTSARTAQSGVIGRLDLEPFSQKHVLALTSALSRSTSDGGTRGGFVTGSLGTRSVQDIGLLGLESKIIVQQRVLLNSLVSASVTSSYTDRVSASPTVIATDTLAGNTFLIGGASPVPTSKVYAAEARSTATWYSRDNKTMYVAQLQARLDHARLGAVDPHTTFITSSLDALQNGDAISLVRTNGSQSAAASSVVIAPALGARRDVGKNGSLIMGVRADAWSTSGIASSGTMQYVDVSPRAALYERIGRLAGNGGDVATLRAGAGRFTSWPDVEQWADAWTGAGASVESCSGAEVPAVTLDSEMPSCASGGTIQTISRAIAGSDLRPVAANRADVSLAFTRIVPGMRGEIGAAVARNDRLTARVSPLVGAPVVDRLSGEDGRALLVSQTAIGPGGVVPIAPIPGDVSDVTRLESDAWSNAAQWRVGISTQDPFARFDWRVMYTLSTGRERTLAIASPTAATGFITAPLAVGGRHAVAFSLSEWIGSSAIDLSGIARSGARFTPLADRDLNGDGLVNDAAYIPAAKSQAWSSVVSPSLRSCVRAAAGHIAGINSCTAPWSVSSLLSVRIPAAGFGLPLGSEISAQLSNPFALFGHVHGITFGRAEVVSPTLEHVTGFDQTAHRFTGEPLIGFGMPLGLSSGISGPVRLAVSIRLPLGPPVASQRADAALATLRSDTTREGRASAAMEYVGDVPPVPLLMLQSGDVMQLTSDQRHKLQALGARWQGSAARIVLGAFDGGEPGTSPDARKRLLRARMDFLVEAQGLIEETRKVLSPDQIDLAGMQRILNPRLWKYLMSQDAGEI